jgi:lipid A disaccharide synthetase
LVKVKFANIINIAAKEEIIPELLQSKCNSKNIYNLVSKFLETPSLMQEQIKKTQEILNQFKTTKSSSDLASDALIKLI